MLLKNANVKQLLYAQARSPLRLTSTERLINKLGWEKMESRRKVHRLTQFVDATILGKHL